LKSFGAFALLSITTFHSISQNIQLGWERGKGSKGKRREGRGAGEGKRTGVAPASTPRPATGIIRDAPITHWPIISRPIIGAKQSADYQLIQKVPETGQNPAVHTV